MFIESRAQNLIIMGASGGASVGQVWGKSPGANPPTKNSAIILRPPLPRSREPLALQQKLFVEYEQQLTTT